MKYRKGYKYQVAEDFLIQTPFYPKEAIVTRFIVLNINGLMLIREAYAWDGASGPTLDTDDTMTPSLVHDAFYQLLREQLLSQDWRPKIDEYLGSLMKDRAATWEPLKSIQYARAALWSRETKKFAGEAASPKNAK